MLEICLEQLADITQGRLRLAAMPPLAGSLEPVRRIVVEPSQLAPRDVFWQLGSGENWQLMQVQDAFCRGALGVVVQRSRIEPWAGTFVLEVVDAAAALERLLRCGPGTRSLVTLSPNLRHLIDGHARRAEAYACGRVKENNESSTAVS